MNSFVMIGGVISAYLVLFLGLRLERYLAYCRVVSSVVAAALVVLTIATNQTALLGIFTQSTGIRSAFNILLHAEGTWKIVLLATTTAAGAAVAIMLQSKTPKIADAVSDLLLFPLLASIPFIEGWITLPVSIAYMLMATTGILAAAIHVAKPTAFLIWTTSLTGGTVAALLFTRFYYLPLWVFLGLTVLFSLSGIVSQTLGHNNRIKTDRVMNGEESV